MKTIKDVFALRLSENLQIIVLLIVALTWMYILNSLPVGNNWAFAFLRYVSYYVRLVFILIVLITTLFIILNMIFDDTFYFSKFESLKFNQNGDGRFAPIVFVIALVVIWLFKERTIWGDGLQIISVLEGRDLPWNSPYIWCWHEPLTWFITKGWYHFTHSVLNFDGQRAIQTLNTIFGAMCITAVWRLASKFAKSYSNDFLLFLFLLSAGYLQVLFAHVENYTLAMLFIVLFLTEIKFKNMVSIVDMAKTGVLSGFAVSAYLGSVYAIASSWIFFLFLLLSRKKLKHSAVFVFSSVVPVILTFSAAWLYGADLSYMFLHQEHLITSVSAIMAHSHLKNVVNSFILTSLPILLLLVVSATKLRKLSFGRSEETLSLLLTLSAFFMFRSTIPRPIDWDIFAPIALSMMIVVGIPLFEALQSSVALWVVVISFTFTLPWVATNALVTRVWPDFLAPERDIPYRQVDLIKVYHEAKVSKPALPLCSGPPSKCAYVTVTKFGFNTPAGYIERRVLFDHPPASITYSLTLPKGHFFLWAAPALDPIAASWPGDGVTFMIKVRGYKTPIKTIWKRYIPKNEIGWHQVFLDLSPYAGREVTLTFLTGPGPAGDFTGDRAGWGMLWIMRGRFEGTYQDLWRY